MKSKSSTEKRRIRPCTLSIIILMLWLTAVGCKISNTTAQNKTEYITEPFEYRCEEEDKKESNRTDVIVNCLQFEEPEINKTYIHFELTNKNIKDADCYFTINASQEGKDNIIKKFSAGIVKAEESKHIKTAFLMPDGETKIRVSPECEFLE